MFQTIYPTTLKTIVCILETTILTIRPILQKFKVFSFKIFIALKKLTEEKVFNDSFQENKIGTVKVDSFILTMNLN